MTDKPFLITNAQDDKKDRMKAEIVKFVRHCDVPAYEECGWIATNGLKDTHHGHHSTIMRWPSDDPPAMPSAMMEKPCA